MRLYYLGFVEDDFSSCTMVNHHLTTFGRFVLLFSKHLKQIYENEKQKMFRANWIISNLHICFNLYVYT